MTILNIRKCRQRLFAKYFKLEMLETEINPKYSASIASVMGFLHIINQVYS